MNSKLEKEIKNLSDEYRDVVNKIQEVNNILSNLHNRRIEIEGALKSLNNLNIEQGDESDTEDNSK